MKEFFYCAIETGGSSVSDGTMSNSSLTKYLFGIDCSLFISANRYITGCLLLTVIDSIIKILVDHIGSVALHLPPLFPITLHTLSRNSLPPSTCKTFGQISSEFL